jgi:hypothetical protein
VFDRSVIKYSTAKIIDAHPDHADYLAPRLRAADKIECMCLGKKPIEALHEGFEHDLATLTILNEEEKPVAMFGIGEGELFPYIWMLGTDELSKKCKKDIVKYSKQWVEELLKLTGGIAANFVYKYNRPAVRWLRWLGADFVGEIEFNKEPFYKFILINNKSEELCVVPQQ